jgi:urease accessory protein
MHLISGSIVSPNATLPVVAVRVGRLTLAKRLWRGAADDGLEFGFELERPLKHRDTVHETATVRYVIEQIAEPVVEISLEVAPSAAAGIGWAIGNLHLELQAEPARLLAADEPAVRQLLGRFDVPFRPTTAIFRPGRFARGAQPTHELGPSHQH